MESGHIKSKKIVIIIIALIAIISIGGIVFFILNNGKEVCFGYGSFAIWLILFIALFSVVFGLLPIIILLRKTPSEIMAMYDI